MLGKSTLLKIISGEIALQSPGSLITLNDRPMPKTSVLRSRPNLNQDLDMLQNIIADFPLSEITVGAAHSKAKELIRFFELNSILHQRSEHLHIYEKQKVALVKAVLSDVPILILDEFFSAVEAHSRAKLIREVLEFHLSYPRPMIFVTHDMDEVKVLASRIIDIKESNEIKISLDP